MNRWTAAALALATLLAGSRRAGAAPGDGPCSPFDPTEWVDPMIGTGGHGHTFPGASVPFGLVQLSPDTRLEGWDSCAGYHHSDDVVYGFSHTHLSGTGVPDYGDVLLVPTVGDVQYANGADGKPGYRSRFSHDRERAEAGYYSVVLDDPHVRVELTATARVGFHRYTFPSTDRANVVLDLTHRDEVLDSSVEVVSDRELRGFRRSHGWANDQRVYFDARFSRAFASFGIVAGGEEVHGRKAKGKNVKAHVRFDATGGEPVVVAVGVSGVDEVGAAANLDAEATGLGFDDVRARARAAWREELSGVVVEGGTRAQLRSFYTALYHAFLVPNVFSDVDGRYRGMDGEVHRARGYEHYTVFSLWDTFRAEHPLLTILEPRRTDDLIRTLLADYKDGGTLPVWELWGNETGCMIGYHAVPVIADALMKGFRGFKPALALEAMEKSASEDRLGLAAYRENGYIPSEEEGESVSRTVEYAYDDWCIAMAAKALGRDGEYRAYLRRAQAYRNLYDPASGFLRAKRNGAFTAPFDPAEVSGSYTEANAWQYSPFVPQDVDGLMRLHGGKAKFAAWLDRLFASSTATTGRDQPDISGQIGQYAHGNEPSHHIAYLYCHAGQPWKTQQRVRQILDTLYTDAPDGLCGNEDCGQMSAWYVLSALGFYPVTPGTNEYVIGTPLFPRASIRVGGDRWFTVTACGTAPASPYVQSATLDGEPLLRPVLRHETLVAGGDVVFRMGPSPSRWGSGEGEVPRTSIDDVSIVPVPLVTKGERVFRGSTDVEVASADGASEVRLSLDGGKTFSKAAGPVHLEASADVVAYAVRGAEESPRVHARFTRVPQEWKLTLGTKYGAQYPATGANALIDGLHGRERWWTGDWQGYGGVDLDATIDLGKATDVHAVRAGFLQDVGSWIWMPLEVRVTVSDDGKTFRDLGTATHDVDEKARGRIVRALEVKGEARARFVRLVAKTRGKCPAWHPGAGHPAWIFADEIEVNPGP